MNVLGGNDGSPPPPINICFGDGVTASVKRTSYAQGEPGIAIATFETTHTYSSSGIFQISVQDDFRSGDVLNFPNSIYSKFFVWTVINTQIGNSTPEFEDLTLSASVGQVYETDLGPKTTDKDSISYKLVRLSKPSPGTCGVRMTAYDYTYPNDVSKTGTFKIDATRNKLVWTAPELAGTYLFAVVASEWHDGVVISETYREGLITASDRGGEHVVVPPYQSAEDTGVLTGVKPGDSEFAISVNAFPIPTQDYLNVNVLSNTRAVISIEIIDINGRVVSSQTSSSAEVEVKKVFDLSRFVPGLYIVKASNGNGVATKKIVR